VTFSEFDCKFCKILEKLKMRMFVTIFFAVASVATAQHQQQLDPAYLRQYYSQVAQQAGAEGSARATPIFEQQDQPQYQQHNGPLKNVSDDFRFHS
jgi:hypothetical protein